MHQCDAQLVDGHDEASWASFEIPAQLPSTTSEDYLSSFFRAAERLHVSIATRTIIAAARGGRLKRIYAGFRGFDDTDVEEPFAIPSLLPFWVAMEEWYDVVGSMEGCQVAALTLRRLLAHASLWLDIADGSFNPRQNRQLTRQEIQSLSSRYSHIDVYMIIPLGDIEPTLDPDEEPHPLERYMDWLAQDAKVAQAVADVWNSIVERGQAEDQDCLCVRCLRHRGEI